MRKDQPNQLVFFLIHNFMIDFLLPLTSGVCFLAVGCLQPPSWIDTFAIIAGGISCFNAGIKFCDYINKKNEGE